MRACLCICVYVFLCVATATPYQPTCKEHLPAHTLACPLSHCTAESMAPRRITIRCVLICRLPRGSHTVAANLIDWFDYARSHIAHAIIFLILVRHCSVGHFKYSQVRYSFVVSAFDCLCMCMCLCVCVCLRSQFVLLAVDLVAPAARHRWTIGQPTVQARLLAQLCAKRCHAMLCRAM